MKKYKIVFLMHILYVKIRLQVGSEYLSTNKMEKEIKIWQI